jgi:phosphatidylglycerophosphate synthase
LVLAVRLGPIIGLIAQIVLLTGLAVTVGLGGAGWGAGVLYGIFLCAALTLALARVGGRAFGPADWVTLSRATLVGGVTALTVATFRRPEPVAVLVAIAAVALVLDAVDGQVARRTGTASGLGARFDMEVDAFLILVLSIYVARSMGLWVLAIGAMRYLFVAASWVVPWLPGPLPPRFWRKVVAAVQGIVLVIAAAGALPAAVAEAAVAGALALLVESFGRDIWWRWRHRPQLSTSEN